MLVPDRDVLANFFPDVAVESVQQILKTHGILLVITRDRTSKLGDFKPANLKKPHRISLNGSLNKHECLLVFLHELAHLDVFNKYGRTVLPHGKEWKNQFGKLIRKCLSSGLFHEDLCEPLYKYSFKVKAAGTADTMLTKMLRAHDASELQKRWRYLDELPEKILFQTRNGRIFQKGDKLRTRYRCHCMQTKRPYLVHSLALAKQVNHNSWKLEARSSKE